MRKHWKKSLIVFIESSYPDQEKWVALVLGCPFVVRLSMHTPDQLQLNNHQ
jgi:hypothetical protein